MIKENQNDYKAFYQRGMKNYKNAQDSLGKENRKLSNEIIYNMLSMALEEIMMSYFIYIGKLPYNHTLKDLFDRYFEINEKNEKLYNDALYLDQFQNICTLENYQRKTPEEKDLFLLKNLTEQIITEVTDKIPV